VFIIFIYFKICNNIITAIAVLCLYAMEVVVHTSQTNLGPSIEERSPLNSTIKSSSDECSYY